MKKLEPVWVIIHMAHTQQRADQAVELLTREGFMVKARPVARALSSGDTCYEVIALSSEAKEARDILRDAGW
ncbi:MAG: hypothetical protein RSJ41_07130 [Clostridia bacterium]